MLEFNIVLLNILLKDKKDIRIIGAFENILSKSERRPKEIQLDKTNKLHNTSLKSWLQDDNVKMYSTHNAGKSFVAQRFIRTLKIKIYKLMT